MRGGVSIQRAGVRHQRAAGVVGTAIMANHGHALVQRHHCGTSPSSSLAAGFFKVKIHPKEMFPFPTRAFTSEEGDNLETIVRNVQEKQSATLLRDVVDWGVAGSPIAAEYGGLQLSETAHSVSLEELARHAPASSFLSLMQHAAPCSYLIKSFGSSGVRARYLSGMSDATIKMSWAVQEQHAGDDISMNLATATSHEDGSHTISGTKLVAFASDATHFLVLARAPTQTAGPDGPIMVEKATFFVVERASKGVTVEASTHASNRSVVTFEGALALDVVGAVGDGHVQYMVTLHSTHHLVSAALVGVLKRMLSIATSLAKEAKDASTSPLPALVAAAAVEVYGLESALYALTANLDVPVSDSLIEATICAALVSRTAQTVGARLVSAVQYATPSESTAMTLAANDLAEVLSLTENSEFLFSVAACCGVEDFGLYFQKASTLETMQLRAMRGLGFRDALPNSVASSWPEAKKIEERVLSFGAAVEHVFVRQNIRLRHATLTLNRIGEAAALLYASIACVARVQMSEKKGVASGKKIASQFIAFAMARADELCDECRHSGKTADEAFKRIAMECAEEATRKAGGVPELKEDEKVADAPTAAAVDATSAAKVAPSATPASTKEGPAQAASTAASGKESAPQ